MAPDFKEWYRSKVFFKLPRGVEFENITFDGWDSSFIITYRLTSDTATTDEDDPVFNGIVKKLYEIDDNLQGIGSVGFVDGIDEKRFTWKVYDERRDANYDCADDYDCADEIIDSWSKKPSGLKIGKPKTKKPKVKSKGIRPDDTHRYSIRYNGQSIDNIRESDVPYMMRRGLGYREGHPVGGLSVYRSKNRRSSPDYTKVTVNGFSIYKIFDSFGQYDVLAKNDAGMWVWGRNYDLDKGYWQGGDYRHDIGDLYELVTERHFIGKLVQDNHRGPTGRF